MMEMSAGVSAKVVLTHSSAYPQVLKAWQQPSVPTPGFVIHGARTS